MSVADSSVAVSKADSSVAVSVADSSVADRSLRTVQRFPTPYVFE